MAERIPLVVFGAVFAAFMASYLFRVARRQRIQAALRRRLGSQAGDAAALLLKQDEPERAASSFARLVAESGFGWSVGTFVTRMVGAGALGGLVGAVLGGAALAVVLAAAGLAALPIAARRAHTKRLALCDQQMPQALEIMALALRAGHPLPTALAIAASEAPAPISDELARLVEEHELGREIGDVLVAFGKRLEGCEAVHTFVVAVLVLQQTGGNLIAVIERIVENARARAQYKAKLRALTAEGRSSARMLGFLPVAFAMLAMAVDPSYGATLLGDPAGNVLLAVCTTLWLVGLLWTRRLVKTED